MGPYDNNIKIISWDNVNKHNRPTLCTEVVLGESNECILGKSDEEAC